MTINTTRLSVALTLALLAAPGCALDPGVAAILATALEDGPASPRPTGTVNTQVTGTGTGVVPNLPVIGTGTGAVLGSVTGGMRDPAPGSNGEQVLDVVNQARALAGIPPVTLDPSLSNACAKHAHYMVLNAGTPAITEALNAHKEQEGLPGYTAEGAKAGAAADLSWGQAPVPAVLGLIATLYHRTPILNSNVVKIGYAFEKDTVGGDASVLMFEYGGSGARKVAAFPADGQTDVPLAFDGGERPNPVPDDAGITGYPVTLALPGGAKATNVKGQLFDDTGAEVPIYYSDDDHPASYFQQGNVVCMFAKKPMKQGTTYRASVSADLDGKPTAWNWKFTTITPKEVDADDVAAVKSFFGK
ncbi:MAG: hypothetical protein JWM80_4686 [Cyanobacteria bacterium RYN_339]|nr:hypothetical protein [Cyanobacteria bacterium RYN_339]